MPTQAEHQTALEALATSQERLDYASTEFAAQSARLKSPLHKAILAKVEAALVGDSATAIALQLARGEALIARSK